MYTGTTFGTRSQARPSTKILEVHASQISDGQHIASGSCSFLVQLHRMHKPAPHSPNTEPHAVHVITWLLRCITCLADVPLHDEEGNGYWLDKAGQRLDHDPNVSPAASSLPLAALLSLCPICTTICTVLATCLTASSATNKPTTAVAWSDNVWDEFLTLRMPQPLLEIVYLFLQALQTTVSQLTAES